jgi:hypothetical protein
LATFTALFLRCNCRKHRGISAAGVSIVGADRARLVVMFDDGIARGISS